MVRFSWIILSLIHLLPAAALFRPSLLETLYGVQPDSPAYLLLWHRAALFTIVLTLCLWAALRIEVRRVAAVAAAISMIGFLLLYAVTGMPPSLRTIALVDLAGIPFLLLVGWDAFKPSA